MEAWFNTGSLDRIMRLTLAVFLLGVGFIFASGAWQVILVIFGLIALTTATIGICPLYIAFNIDTNSH